MVSKNVSVSKLPGLRHGVGSIAPVTPDPLPLLELRLPTESDKDIVIENSGIDCIFE